MMNCELYSGRNFTSPNGKENAFEQQQQAAAGVKKCLNGIQKVNFQRLQSDTPDAICIAENLCRNKNELDAALNELDKVKESEKKKAAAQKEVTYCQNLFCKNFSINF